jgi:hypothetical protein
MSDMRELTDAELDIVGGGLINPRTAPTRSPEPIIVKLVEELVVDILRVLESNNCGGGPKEAQLA